MPEHDLGWLPRRHDFRFIGIRRDGSRVNCIMKKQSSAFPLFYVANEATGEPCWNEIVAWCRHD